MNLDRAQMIAGDLIRYHLPNGCTFGFDRAARRFGVCKLRANSAPVITFSRALTELNNEEQFLNTVLHEIAHALTPRARHGYEWRAVALAIGCDGQRCYGSDVVRPAAKFVGTCPACHRTIKRFKRTAIACGACCRANGGGFKPEYKFTWERGA